VILTNRADETEPIILQAFLEQYYAQATDIPKRIFSEIQPANANLIARVFKAKIFRTQRGEKSTLAKLARENALQGMKVHLANFEKNQIEIGKALRAIASSFHLAHSPKRIEAYDIANISGKHATGSMVVFIDGRPEKSLYKKFAIRTVEGSNDPAMMAEILKRRVERMEKHEAGWEAPDLILLDGGKGQLSVVAKTLGKKTQRLPLVALAKSGHQKPTEQAGRETFFQLSGKELKLPNPSPELFLLERIRDEAHRFATTFYRGKHIKDQKRSLLDEIPGLGPKRKQALLRHFGSVAGIQEATTEQISKIIGKSAAASIRQYI
jgi:excinuclease ABC subunit C